MKKIQFEKYQGTGNDFIMIDDRKKVFDIQNYSLITKLCDRRFGIGADGLILLRKHPDYDFEMVYFNADGKQSSMCGNGGRCVVQFAKSLGLVRDKAHFLAIDGAHSASCTTPIIALSMNDVADVEQGSGYYFLDTGSPHYVRFVNDVKDYDVFTEARFVRYNERFKSKGTNVNFVQLLSPNEIFVRTYERGVEDETLSCGTGVTAAAIAASFKTQSNTLSIKTLGGDLRVRFQSQGAGFGHIELIGKAEKVFEGQVIL